MNRLFSIFILLFLCILPTVAMGEWEVFSSNGQYRQMAEYDGRLYALSGSSIFWTDLHSGRRGSISPVDGMHGTDVAFLLSSDNGLVIVYNDGLVDLMPSEGVFHDIPDFRNKVVTGDRTINQAKVCGNELFLACVFGVVQFDLEAQIVRYNYITPSSCQLAFSFGDYLYYCTEKEGLMRCSRNNNYLIGSQWENQLQQSLYDAVVFTDQEGQQRCWITPQSSDLQEIDSIGNIKRLNLWNNREMHPSGPYVFCSGWGVQIVRVSDLKQTYLHTSPFNTMRGYYATTDSTFFALNSTLGFQSFTLDFKTSDDGSFTQIEDESTEELNYQEWLGTKCADLEIDPEGALVAINGDKMWSGGYTKMTTSNSIINTYVDDEWSYILEDSVVNWLQEMVDDPSSIPHDYFRGLTDLAVHPTLPRHYYVGSLTHGLYEFEEGALIAHYDSKNTIDGPVHTSDSEKYTRLTALSFDQEGNLWTGYSFSDCALAVMSPEGKWKQHPLAGNNVLSNVGRIIPTRHGSQPLVWLVQNYGYQKCSVSVLYNPGGAMDASKDQSVTFHSLIDQDNNIIDLNYIYDICEDLDGAIWILTTNGPFKVEDPVATFNYAAENPGRGLVRRIKIPRNDGTNLADYLMANTPCTCMAIDNYNRKWIGTNGNGIYLLSADCITEIQHFDAVNSLLPSDDIVAMAYDEMRNKLFISTGSGLTAYHTDDLVGSTNYNNMYCYPNPVRPEYNGELRIMGVMDGSTVSITDATGNLIYRTECQGSTATWNLRQNDGERVTQGVYLIHGTSEDGKEGRVVKVLVL